MLRYAVCLLIVVLLASAASADVVRILDDDREAFQARADLIHRARNDISALYFLAKNDRITMTGLALLREARRRGVPSVRVVVDANFSRVPKPILAHLAREGVQIRVYHPLTLRHPGWLFRRMHDKLIVTDAERYITGGRNLAEAYFGLAKKRNYVDRDIYVDGASASDAACHFEEVWASDEVSDLHVRVPERQVVYAEHALDGVMRSLRNGNAFVSVDSGRDWSDGSEDADGVRFLYDGPAPASRPGVTSELLRVLASATESIVIESPYLVPTRSLREMFETKAAQGVRVTILTNSLRSTDGVFPHAAYMKYRGRLIEKGIDIREFKGPDPLHAKSVVVDGRVFLVGSYNIDPRSHHLNTEVMSLGEDEKLAASLLESIRKHLENSWSFSREGVPNEPQHYPGVSIARSIRARAARLLILPLVEKQL